MTMFNPCYNPVKSCCYVFSFPPISVFLARTYCPLHFSPYFYARHLSTSFSSLNSSVLSLCLIEKVITGFPISTRILSSDRSIRLTFGVSDFLLILDNLMQWKAIIFCHTPSVSSSSQLRNGSSFATDRHRQVAGLGMVLL